MPTRKQYEEAVLEYIRERGGASIFWITAHQARACAVMRLEEMGVIVREVDDERDLYPWCVFSVEER